MSSKRDLVEAHGYNRRRLVTAFVSGAPGGREVEPVRYGRTLVGGLVLALLVVAGAAVSGLLAQPVAKDWAESGLVIGKTSGSRFYAYQDTLYPVINITSARLLLSDDSKPELVADDLIAGKKAGATIGIAGAPEVLPAPGKLAQTGWSACTNTDGGIRLTVGGARATRAASGHALVVTSDSQTYVVTGQRRYQLPDGADGQAVLRNLKLDGQPPVEVSGLWLDLFAPGTTLALPQLPGQGRASGSGVAGLGEVGTPVGVDGRHYVVETGRKLIELSDFAAAVNRGTREEVQLDTSDIAGLRTDTVLDYTPRDWPTGAVSTYATPQTPCATLVTSSGKVSQTELADPASDSALATSSAVSPDVAVGSGAVVRTTTGGVVGSGDVQLVDAGGTRYTVGTASTQSAALKALGYGSVTPVPVTKPWLELFRAGPALTTSAAVRTPGSSSTSAAVAKVADGS